MNDTLLKSCVGKRCTVLSGDNRFLFRGEISVYDKGAQEMELISFGDRELWQDLAFEMTIKIQLRAEGTDQNIIIIEAKVKTILKSMVLVDVLSVISKKEARNFFRQSVKKTAVIDRVNGEKAGHPCVILDVSATGIAIETEAKYELGDVLFLLQQRFRENGPAHTLNFQVARIAVRKNESVALYGCRFVNLPTEEEDKLFSDIFALQAADLSARR